MSKIKILHEAYDAMLRRYGENLPARVLSRFEQERFLLHEDCLRVLYLTARLQETAGALHSPVILHGQYTASFIGYLLGASQVNPLPPHYYCPQCHRFEFVKEARSGFDLPAKVCDCGAELVADGHDIPVEALAQQANHYNSLECSVAGNAVAAVGEAVCNMLGKYGDVVALQVEGDEGNTVYVSFPAGKAPATDADGSLHLSCQEYGEKYIDLPHVRVNCSEFADRLQTAWSKAGGTPTPRQFCEEENLLRWQLERAELSESLAEAMLEQTLQFSSLVQEQGFLYGNSTWLGNGEKLVAQGVDFMDIPVYREEVYQKIAARHPEAQGLALRVMDETRKGKYEDKGMPAETGNALREWKLKPWFIDYCKAVGYLFPKAHAVEYLCWELTMTWFMRRGFGEAGE